MEYFTNVKQKSPPEPDKTPAPYRSMVERVESRAMEAIKIGSLQNMANSIITDPRGYDMQSDSETWLIVLQLAREQDIEIYSRLFYLRGGGTWLVKDEKWGYVMAPAIAPGYWDSIEQYNQEKTCLDGYGQQIVDIFRKARIKQL